MRPEIVKAPRSVSERGILAVEKKYRFRLPEGYRAFLLETNGGEPRPRGFRRKGSKKYSEVCDYFFGIRNGRDYADLEQQLDWYKDKDEPRIPDRLVPIAGDPFGNLICISTAGKDVGKVFFWDHEAELGQKRVKGKGVNDAAIWLIADSFDGFLEQFEKASVKGKGSWEKLISGKDLAGFRRWLDEGGDVRRRNREMETPMSLAVNLGARELIREMVRRGAAVEELLEAMINEADWDMAKWLLALPEAKKFKVVGWHFQMALGSGDVELVRRFLDAGASVEMELQSGKPLHYAAGKDGRMVKLLLDRGAKVGEEDSTGRFALTGAVQQGNLEAAKLLMDAGEDLYREPRNGVLKRDREMLAELEELEKEGKKETAPFIKMQRLRIENNRVKAPFFYLQFQKDRAFKKAVVDYARKLGQKER